jgi:hypothetical protein
MKWTTLTLPCLLGVTLAACGPRQDRESGASGTGSETGAMTDTTIMDTASPPVADTSAGTDTSVKTTPGGTGTTDTGANKPSSESGVDSAR